MGQKFKAILLNPPFLDPTVPPHFAAYLVGAARHSGVEASIIFNDLNIELLNFACTKRFFELSKTRIGSLINSLDVCSELSPLEELKLRYALQIQGLCFSDVESSLQLFKTSDNFYDFTKYQAAVSILTRYISSLTSLGLPGIFSLWDLHLNLYGSTSSIEDLTNNDLIHAISTIFDGFLEAYLNDLEIVAPDLIGISCNYVSQLPYTALLTRQINQRFPDIALYVGGTEITDIYKNIKNKMLLWELFPRHVHLVVGEGEGAFTEILKNNGSKIKHSNVISHDSTEYVISAQIENINEIGDPAYDIYDYSKYWSPKPILLYSPTRGCYWNKCTFCDYGLNFGLPTSPARQRYPGGIEQDLSRISEITDIVYFAVDAIPPNFLKRISQIIYENGIPISWSAEIRLEKTITDKKMGKILADGGCIALSFGFESGSQRILDRIKKGVELERVPDLLSDLSAYNIKVQLMGFLGFPEETKVDAVATFDFLDKYRDYWTLSGVGNFVLTPGAIVAKDFRNFGITGLIDESTDIVRELTWIDNDGVKSAGSRHNDVREHRGRNLIRSPFSRPFVGGIDAGHTLLYFQRYGDARSWEDAVSRQEEPTVSDGVVQISFANFMKFADIDDLKKMRKCEGGMSMRLFLNKISNKRKVEKGKVTVIIKQSGKIYKRVTNNLKIRWLEKLYL